MTYPQIGGFVRIVLAREQGAGYANLLSAPGYATINDLESARWPLPGRGRPADVHRLGLRGRDEQRDPTRYRHHAKLTASSLVIEP